LSTTFFAWSASRLTGALKEDAEELEDIAKGKGSLKDKAKEAAEAIKDPGAEGPDKPAG
jgi:hypothetical protein